MGHFHSAANDPLCSLKKAFENVRHSVPKDEVNHGPKLQICHKKARTKTAEGEGVPVNQVPNFLKSLPNNI